VRQRDGGGGGGSRGSWDRQRQRRERDARRIERLTTPYSRAPDCTAQLDASKLAAIEELVAQRLAAKLRRDFAESDALLQRLLDSGVRVTDDHRLWRSDDRPFVVPYRQEGGGIPRLGTGGTTRIEALVLERGAAKASKDYRRADALEAELSRMRVGLEISRDQPRSAEMRSR